MGKRMFFFILMMAMTFTSVVMAEVPLPTGVNIVKPESESVIFSGIWDGTWRTGNQYYSITMETTIVVEKIEGETVAIVYAIRSQGKDSHERVMGKLSNPKEIDFKLKSGAKVNLFFNTSQKKMYGKYTKGNVESETILSPRP